jgi:hypothetical protein
MNSSYLSNLDFSDVLATITQLKKPTKIIEFGILDGFSLKTFLDNSNPTCQIEGYDIFEDFNGNGAIQDNIIQLFKNNDNVQIKKQDFYNKQYINNLENNSVDIIHIDIANNGDVYEFAIQNYLPKLKKDGILLLEGGSKERDNVEWMVNYNKPKIQPVLEKYKNQNQNIIDIFVLDKFPSITMITYKQ